MRAWVRLSVVLQAAFAAVLRGRGSDSCPEGEARWEDRIAPTFTWSIFKRDSGGYCVCSYGSAEVLNKVDQSHIF